MSMDDLKSLAISFHLANGLSKDRPSTKRHLSKMAGMYADAAAYKALLPDNPLVYEFYEMGLPEQASEIAFGTSITYPGKVGDEYFMTKGHFHTILETAEVYYCLSGTGMMLMENPEGDWEARELTPGVALYVPARYAHRSINTGSSGPLVTFFAFRSDAGHDYGTIETKGFRKLVVERDGAPCILDNPKWQGS